MSPHSCIWLHLVWRTDDSIPDANDRRTRIATNDPRCWDPAAGVFPVLLVANDAHGHCLALVRSDISIQAAVSALAPVAASRRHPREGDQGGKSPGGFCAFSISASSVRHVASALLGKAAPSAQ